MRTDSIEVFLAIARFGVLPGFAGPVEKGLRGAVEHTGSGPLAAVGGQARQAEGGVGEAGPFTVAAAHPQGGCEAGPRAVRVTVLAQRPAQVGRYVRACLAERPHHPGRLLQMGPGCRDVPGAQGVHAGVVVQDASEELVAGPPGARDGLGEQRLGASRVDGIDAQQVPRHALGQHDVIAQQPGPLDGLLAERNSSLGLAGEVAGGAQDREGFDEQPAGAQLAGESDRPFAEPPRRRYVNQASTHGGDQQRPSEQFRIEEGFRPLQHRHQQGTGLRAPVARQPVAPQGDAEAQDPRGPARVAERVPRRAAQVRLIGVQPRKPFALVGSGQMGGGQLGDGQVVLAVGRGGGDLVFAGLGEPVGGELADGLKQPVAKGSPGRLGHHQALVHQGTEKIGDVEHLNVARAADRFGGVQVEALGEHRQAAQQRLLGAVEQRIGPVDGRLQGLLPRQGGTASAGEQPETLVEAVVQAGQGQGAQPGGGELDGQRQPVQPAADREDKRAGLLVEGKASALCLRPVGEQRDRIAGPSRVSVIGAGK